MNPHTALRLEYNLRTNLGAATAIDILNVGMDGREGFFQGEFSSGSSSDSLVNLPRLSEGPVQKISIRTLGATFQSEFGKETVDLCKMDIEGAEYSMFENDAESLRRVRFFVIEAHRVPSKELSTIVNAVLGLGFKVLHEDKKEHVLLFQNKYPI